MATAPTNIRLASFATRLIAGTVSLALSESAVLTGSGGGVTTGGIQWDAVPGADSYKIYWGTAVASLTNSQDVGNVTSFDWTDLSPRMSTDTTYYVQVRTIDNSVESTAWGTTVWLNGSQVG